jgi:hypothetical protein
MKLTRRKLAVSALASAAALGQTPAPAPSDNPDELLQAAREQNRRNGETLAKFAAPAATEPAFQFKP